MSSVRFRLDIPSCILRAQDLAIRLQGEFIWRGRKFAHSPNLLVAPPLSIPHLACLGRNCNWALP
jgi:hypothetical protein